MNLFKSIGYVLAGYLSVVFMTILNFALISPLFPVDPMAAASLPNTDPLMLYVYFSSIIHAFLGGVLAAYLSPADEFTGTKHASFLSVLMSAFGFVSAFTTADSHSLFYRVFLVVIPLIVTPTGGYLVDYMRADSSEKKILIPNSDGDNVDIPGTSSQTSKVIQAGGSSDIPKIKSE